MALFKVYDTEVIPAVAGDPGQVGYTSCPGPPPPPPPPGGGDGGGGGPGSGGGSGGGGICPEGSVYTCIIVTPHNGGYGQEFCYCAT